MIFGLSIGKSDSDSKSKQKSTTEIDKTTTVDSSKTGTESTTGSQQTSQQTQQLDEETQGILRGLIEQAGGTIGTSSDELAKFAEELKIRGQETESVINQSVADIIGEQERKGRLEISRLQTNLAQSAGSTQNAFVSQTSQDAEAALASQLAASEAQLGIAARQAGGQDLLAAFNASAGVPGAQGQETANVVNLVNALKGSTATVTGEATTSQQTLTEEQLASVEQIVQVIENITKGSAQGENKGFNFGINI